MSQIPRRTSEFQASSVRKSANPRPSRIGSLQQTTSANARFSQARVSATPSRNRMTPAKTPTRSSSRDRITMIPMTAEKEKAPVDDKAFIQSKTIQVLEEISRIDGFSELVQKGLKSMTHKQFILILQHFFKPIVGNVTIDASNYVDYIYNIIQVMEYPYTINKSSLKTPSAPHCQNSIIILLAWLSEFTLKENDTEPLMHCCEDEDFTSEDMTKMFMEKTADAFVFWNNQQEPESDDIMLQIRQMYIKKKIGSGCLETEINRLKGTIVQLENEAKPLSLQKDYKTKRDESKMLSDRTTDLHKSIDEISATIEAMKGNLKSKHAKEAKLAQELKSFRKKISKQKLTTAERNRLLMEISEAKSVLASKKKAAMELIETSSTKEIQLSNLIMKKFKLIDQLNNYIYFLGSDLEIAGMNDKFDPSAYEIKTSKVGEAAALNNELDRLKLGLDTLNQKYKQSLCNMEQAITQLDGEKHSLLVQNEMMARDLDSLTSSLEKIAADELAVEADLHSCIQRMETKCQQNDADIKRINEDIKELQKLIANHNEIIPQIIESKEKFKLQSLETCKNFLEKRKKEAELGRQRVNEMKALIAKYNKVEAETFPQSLQNSIDELLDV